MGSTFVRLVQEGKLIELEIEGEAIKNAFCEVLKILSGHEVQLNIWEALRPELVLLKEFNAFKEESELMVKKMASFQENVEKKIEDFETDFTKKLDDMKEYVDVSKAQVLVEVRRYLNSEMKDLIEAERTARSYGPGSRITQGSASSSGDLREFDERLQMLQQDLNAVRKSGETKIQASDVQKMIDKEIAPIKAALGQVDLLQHDLSGVREDMKAVEGEVEAAKKRPTRTVTDVNFDRPVIRPPVTGPIMIEDSEPPKPIQLAVLPPPLDENASVERQLRHLNEMSNGFRMAIETLQENVQGNCDRIKTVVQQSNLKHVQLTADIDQVYGHIERLREKLAGMPPDVSKEVEALRKDVEALKREGGRDLSARRIIHRPDIHIAERLPPLPTLSIEPTKEDETFGLVTSDERADIPHIPTSSHSGHAELPSAKPKRNASDRGRGSSDSEDEHNLTPENSGRKATRQRDVNVRILKAPVKQMVEPALLLGAIPQISQSEIEEKVDAAIKKSIVGFLERAKIDTMKAVDERLKVVDTISTQIDLKIDRDYCERMFNRFRLVALELKNKIEEDRSTFMGWITREELEVALEKLMLRLTDIKDTAVASSKYNCLLCGKPRTHVAGMFVVGDIQDDGQNSRSVEERQRTRPSTRISAPHIGFSNKRAITPAAPRDGVQLLNLDD
jgi:hypothetical protein